MQLSTKGTNIIGTDTYETNIKGTDTRGSDTKRTGTKGAGTKSKNTKESRAKSADSKKTSARRTNNAAKIKTFRTPFTPFRSLLLFPLIILYDELILRAMSGVGIFYRFGFLLFFTLGFGLFLTAVTSFFRRKTNRIITLILLIILQLLFATESVIHSVYTTFMAPGNIFSAAGNVAGNYGGELARSILFGIPKILVFFLPVILFAKFGKRIVPSKRYIPLFCLGLLILSFLLTGITALVASHGKNAAVYGAQFDYDRATDTFGLVTSTRLSLKYNLFGNRNSTFQTEAKIEATDTADLMEEEADQALDSSEVRLAGNPGQTAAVNKKHEMQLDLASLANSGNASVRSLTNYIQTLVPADENAYTGLFAGKNLIMISAESYCSAFITPELTPTLWRLTHNGFYFSEYYQPEWGGSTTTGELSYLVGLAPRDGDESMIKIKDNNNYFTMGNQLQRLGYSSCAFHNGSIMYYQRENTHRNLGYNQFIGNEDGMTDMTGYDYCHDGDMIDKTIDYYLDKEPFSIYYMTLSGHAPYEEDSELVAEYYNRVDSIVGDEYEETTKYYICYQMELESALTLMLEKLEQAGIADDTVIVLVGDHFPYGLCRGEAWGNSEDYFVDLTKSERSMSWQQDRNGLIIWSGALENELKDMQCEISTPVFSLDILPTLSNLFGVEYDSRLLPGRDVFSDAEPLVFWNNMCWVTERGFYDSSEEEFYPREGYDYDSEYVRRMKATVENRLLFSRTIMENDYYRLLFGPDEVLFAGQMIFPMTQEEKEAEQRAAVETDPYYTGVESYEGETNDLHFDY